VSEWLWRYVAGLNPDEQHPGYKSFMIRPRPSKEVSWCKAGYDSIRGPIVSNWKRVGDKVTLEITIPVNTTAVVFIPASSPAVVTESGRPASRSEGVTFLRTESGTVVYQVSSGVYRFDSLLK
jgi:alpha-L-rhamnosidase